MNEEDLQNIESELRRAQPARLPGEFMARLKAAKPEIEPTRKLPPQPAVVRPAWRGLLHWLAPAMALAVVGLLVWKWNFRAKDGGENEPLALAKGLMADDVKVNEELVTSFDVVARMPNGMPVRFRCKKWNNQLVITDTNRGVEIAESNPRVEVVPVRFETY